MQGHRTSTGLRAKGVGFWSQPDWPRRDLVFAPVKWEYPLPSPLASMGAASPGSPVGVPDTSAASAWSCPHSFTDTVPQSTLSGIYSQSLSQNLFPEGPIQVGGA